MKRELVTKGSDILITVLNHLLFVAAAITVFDLFTMDQTGLGLWIGMMIVPFFLDFVRMKIDSRLFFYAIHLVVIIVVGMLPPVGITKVLMMAITLIDVAYSVYLKMISRDGKQELIPPALVIVLFGLFEMIEKLKDKNDWSGYCLGIALVYLCIYFVNYFFKNYLQYLIMNEKTAGNLSEREIFHHGMKHTFLFCFGSIFVLLFASNLDWFSKIMRVIGIGIRDLLKELISGMKPPKQVEENKELLEQTEMEMGDFFEGAFFSEAFLEVMEKICLFLAGLFIILLVVSVILIFYNIIKGNFRIFKKKKVEEVLASNGDIRESCEIEHNRKMKEKRNIFLSTRDRARKMFRKRILKSKKFLIGDQGEEHLVYFTAKECCDPLEERYLKELYEKARYTEDEITTEDLRRVKNMK